MTSTRSTAVSAVPQLAWVLGLAGMLTDIGTEMVLAARLGLAFVRGNLLAWASDGAPAGDRGVALGWMHMVQGLALLPASLMAGLLWQYAGPPASFAAAAACAALTLLLLRRR